MQKTGLFRIPFLVLMLCFGSSRVLLAQTDTLGFTCTLLEVSDPTVEGLVKFNLLIPSTATNKSWDFGDTNTSTLDNPTNSYDITTKDTFTVRLSFKLNSIDSTVKRKICANPAFFIERLDSSTKATYVRILRSAFDFAHNDPGDQGAMRFEWTINDNPVTNIDYPTATDGQLPNIRYTFENSGANKVVLKAWNTADPLKFNTYTRIINILPDFSTKVKLNVPNVFTPNGDKIHDFFEVETSGISRLVLKVFTRTGALVYQKQATFIKWDGKNDNGKDLPEGIYYYIIEDLDKKYENAKGFFYIFRGK
jgi:gliding motility-associated-like protein